MTHAEVASRRYPCLLVRSWSARPACSGLSYSPVTRLRSRCAAPISPTSVASRRSRRWHPGARDRGRFRRHPRASTRSSPSTDPVVSLTRTFRALAGRRPLPPAPLPAPRTGDAARVSHRSAGHAVGFVEHVVAGLSRTSFSILELALALEAAVSGDRAGGVLGRTLGAFGDAVPLRELNHHGACCRLPCSHLR